MKGPLVLAAIGVLLIVLSMLTGCATHSEQVRVLSSKEKIKLQEFNVGPHDYVVCDQTGCRVLED